MYRFIDVAFIGLILMIISEKEIEILFKEDHIVVPGAEGLKVRVIKIITSVYTQWTIVNIS